MVPAKAQADAQVKEAEGYKVSQTARADGDKYATIARADAEQHKRKAEGEGMASATKATGTAEADVIQKKGLAEADVIEKQGLARAVSINELAKAYQQFNEAALTLEVIKVMPQVIESLGTVFGSIASPMGNIDKLVVVDSGGNGKDEGALNRLTKVGPTMLFQFLEQAKAAGIDVSSLLSKVGIKTEDMLDGALSPKTGKS